MSYNNDIDINDIHKTKPTLESRIFFGHSFLPSAVVS